MNRYLVFILFFTFFIACSFDSESKKNGSGASKKNTQGKGNTKKELSVEGYLAKRFDESKEFHTMATLMPLNKVSLSAAASGRLVILNAKDGAKVTKGTLLAKIDDSELKAQLKQAEANRDLAMQKQERIKNLVEKNASTQVDLEAAEASLKASVANVELIKAQIAKTEVRAPFSGKLGFVNVSIGSWLNAGTSIVDLSEVNKLKAKFALPQRYASIVKIGDKIILKDEERNIEKTGKVLALDATISESSRTRQILVTIDNSKDELIAGSFASVKVSLESSQVPVFTIPAEALILDREGAYVFVSDNGKAKIKYVKTGLRTPISVEVTDGLIEGDTVIVSGIISLRPGILVKFKEMRQFMNYEVD